MPAMQSGGIAAIVCGCVFLSACIGIFIYWLKRSFAISPQKDNKKSKIFFIKKTYMNRQNSVAPIQLDVKEQCSICLNELDVSQMNVTGITKCGHTFHLNCLMTWLVRRNVCPLCRYQIPSVHKHIQLLLPDSSASEVHKLSEFPKTESSQVEMYPV